MFKNQRQCCSAFVFAMLTLLVTSAGAQGYLKADGQRIVNEKGDNIILRGIGLGGWMLQEGYMLRINKEGQQYRIRQRIDSLIGPEKTAAFYDAWLSNHTTKADIDSLKRWGFNSVRLPMHYNLFTPPVELEKIPGQQTWLIKGFALTDSLLSWCKSNHMYLILDLHATPGGQGNDANISDRDKSKPSLWESEANRQKMTALWRKLAERYVNEPWIGAYDIINEPNWGFTDLQSDPNGTKEKDNAPLRKLMVDITKAIREVDNKHIIIAEGNGWGNNYNGVMPPWDNNLVLSFHKYWNYNDIGSIRHMLDMRQQYNIPIWIGETGENSNVWFTDAIQLMETNNIGWAWWPLKKLGFNNPAEVRSNPGYDAVLNYLNGNGFKPDPKTAYNGLMQLAESVHVSNAVIHHDVIDAMIRQPHSLATRPYKLVEINGNMQLPAVDYDLGRNGYAYFDTDTADYHVSTGKRTAGNRGRMYRNDGVDIRKDSASQTCYVTAMEKGEWLQYTVQVKNGGQYQLKLQTAAEKPGAKLVLLVNGAAGRPVEVATTSNGRWTESAAGTVTLKSGTHIIRVLVEEGGSSLRSILFEQVSNAASTSTASPAAKR